MLRPDDTVLDAFRVLQERTIQKDRTSILMRHTDFGIEWSICCVGYFVGSLIYPSINRSCRRTSRTMAEFASPSRMNDWSSMQWIHFLHHGGHLPLLELPDKAAIAALFRVINRYVGNLAPMRGVIPGLYRCAQSRPALLIFPATAVWNRSKQPLALAVSRVAGTLRWKSTGPI